MKLMCHICSKGIRIRPIACYTCKKISHARCIKGLSPELYDKHKINMESILHICKFCNYSNDRINANVPEDEEMLELRTADPSPSPLTLAPSHTQPHAPDSTTVAVAVEEEEEDVMMVTTRQLQRSQTNLRLPTLDTTRKLHCQYCDENFTLRKTKRLCKHCKSIFHTKCFKKVSRKEPKCSICISIALPFHKYNYNKCSTLENLNTIENANILETSLINPSQMPDNMYDCFNRRGLHFIHINARSMFHKLSEIRLLALKIKPAIISISETWLKEYITNQSVKLITIIL